MGDFFLPLTLPVDIVLEDIVDDIEDEAISDRVNSNEIFGSDGNDEIEGTSGDDDIIAGAGDDLVFGNDGEDFLFGSDPSVYDSGSGEYDTLTGGAGVDVFVIGDSYEAYYLDYGYAEIADFDYTEDYIRVHGVASDYSLTDFDDGTGIYYQEDLIAFVNDTNNVIIERDFLFV
jgi:serralysin